MTVMGCGVVKAVVREGCQPGEKRRADYQCVVGGSAGRSRVPESLPAVGNRPRE